MAGQISIEPFVNRRTFTTLDRQGLSCLQDIATLYKANPEVWVRGVGPDGWAQLRKAMEEHGLINYQTKLKFDDGLFDFNSAQVLALLRVSESDLDLTPFGDYFRQHNRKGFLDINDGSKPSWYRFKERLNKIHIEWLNTRHLV